MTKYFTDSPYEKEMMEIPYIPMEITKKDEFRKSLSYHSSCKVCIYYSQGKDKCKRNVCPYLETRIKEKCITLIELIYNNEFCQMRYDEENDCYIADYPVDEYTEKYKGQDYIVNGKVEHLYAIGSHEWCWAMAEQEEIEDENNAICVEESTDEMLEEAEPTMSM